MRWPTEEEEKENRSVQHLKFTMEGQACGNVDWVRTRAYWTSKLPTLGIDVLARALTEGLCGLHETVHTHLKRSH